MRRFAVCNAALVLLTMMLAPHPAHAETYFGFTMGVSNAPPAPMLVMRAEPRLEVVPNTRVYRCTEDAGDADVFRFAGTWYAYSNGFWYRAAEARGPYHVTDARNVPRAVLFVPANHWRHHPQGMAAARARRGPAEVVVVRERRGHHWWRR